MSDQTKLNNTAGPKDDPMFRNLGKPAEPKSPKTFLIVLTSLLGLLIAFSIYLMVSINDNKDKIGQLTTDLEASDSRIAELEEKLYATENKLGKKIEATSQEFSALHDQQTKEMQQVKSEVVKKAGKEELATVKNKTDNISSDVGDLKTSVQSVDQNVKKVDTQVVDLNKKVDDQGRTIEEQRKMLEQNIHNINATRELLDSTVDSLANLKTSLDRDYFVFQLDKKTGIVRVKDVGLRLKKTREKEQNYNIEIFYDDKKISKDKNPANVPINFYKMGYKKPYEVVISQVMKDKVTGYLSIPKVTD